MSGLQELEDPRAREEPLRLALEAGEIGAWEWNLASGAMRWSAQMFRNLGLDPGEPGDPYEVLLAALHPDEREGAAAALAEFRGRLGPLRLEARVVWPGGDIRWIVFLGRTEPDAAGRPAVMRGITIDGTRRRRSEEPFRLLAERLRLAMNAGRLATWEIDLARRTAQWSAEAAQMHGHPPQAREIGLEEWLRLVDPEDREVCEKRFAAALKRPGDYRAEYRLARDRARWISVQGSMMLDPEGRPLRVVGVARDISERKRTETALRDSERRLRELNESLERLAEERARQRDASRARLHAFFDSSPDWLTLFRATPDGHFVYEDMNRATELGYGLSRDRVIGRTVEEILGEEPSRLPLYHMRRCFETGENQRYTARRTMAGITRAIDVMFIRVREQPDGPPLIIGTARDITEREAMEEQLRQAQKMEVLGQLTGGVAHDFNNLLTAIIGNLELLGARVADDPLTGKFVDAAMRAAENGARLTEHLLAFSRRQHLRPRTVDLNAVVGGMLDLLTRSIGATVQIETRLAPELWPVMIDATQIEIAILNLAVNARDAMPRGGAVTIETRNLPAGSEEVPEEIGDEDCVCLAVHDTGIGMSEAVLRSAVEPFFTTKEVGKGSGLGLSQVYGVVKQSSGGLRIVSALGRGTRVSIYLPRAVPAAGAGEGRAETAERQESGQVLVVDDDAAVREITVQMLQRIGYGVTEADSGRAALAALAQGGSYDLAVVDIAMPDLDGVETVRRAREIRPGLRVLYTTGYAEPDGAERRTGPDPVIKKPFRLGDLRAAVRRATARGAQGNAARASRRPPARAL